MKELSEINFTGLNMCIGSIFLDDSALQKRHSVCTCVRTGTHMCTRSGFCENRMQPIGRCQVRHLSVNEWQKVLLYDCFLRIFQVIINIDTTACGIQSLFM